MARKIKIPWRIEAATLRLIAQCLNQQLYRVRNIRNSQYAATSLTKCNKHGAKGQAGVRPVSAVPDTTINVRDFRILCYLEYDGRIPPRRTILGRGDRWRHKTGDTGFDSLKIFK